LEATLILVPTYSTRLDFVAAEAVHLGQRHLACTFAVNPVTDSSLEDALYAYAPIKGRSLSGFAGEHRREQKTLPGNATVTVHHLSLRFDPQNAAQLHAGPYVSL
jgi:hypothetical protein